jgi:hypothetical protein
MKAVLCTIAIAVSSVAPQAHADVPPGPDAIHAAFVRLMAHEATTTAVAAVATTPDSDRVFERWVNRVARDEFSSVEAGFARMLARPDEAPARLIAHGEPDPVAVMIAGALQAQSVYVPMLARVGT